MQPHPPCWGVLLAALLLAIAAAPCVAAADPPGVIWQRCLGGTGDEEARDLQRTADGGFIAVGYTTSGVGDVAGYHGERDLWVLRLDQAGGLLWQRCLGGSGEDSAEAVLTAADGTFVVAGRTTSTDGDAAGLGGATGAWVVALNDTGGVLWQACPPGRTGATALAQAPAGGLFLGCYSTDSYSAWIMELNPGGGVVWERQFYAGYHPFDLRPTGDGGVVAVGGTSDVVVPGSHPVMFPSTDLWAVKLNATGAVEWQRRFGSGQDDVGLAVRPAADQGWIVAGYASRGDYDVAEHHGNEDVWVLKLDGTGALEWQRSLGGGLDERGADLEVTDDGGLVVAGQTWSGDGDVTGRHGSVDEPYLDAWVVGLNATGGLDWARCYGGSGHDWAAALEPAPDGGLVIAGGTMSIDGDVAGNHGGVDLWVAKLGGSAAPVLAVPPSSSIPTDPDGDGTYEDVNGNGRADFADVVLYFNAMGWILTNEPVAAFDFNENGRIDFADVVWLFNRL